MYDEKTYYEKKIRVITCMYAGEPCCKKNQSNWLCLHINNPLQKNLETYIPSVFYAILDTHPV